VRTLGVVCALLAGDWRVTGGILKIARCIWEVGVAGWLAGDWPSTGAFSTLLRWASTDGVLAT